MVAEQKPDIPPVEQPSDRRWRVLRMDDHGTVFPVKGRLTESEARDLANRMEELGHKQMYWVEETAESQVS